MLNWNIDPPIDLDEWGVSFEGGFWNNLGNIGTEVSINQPFTWGLNAKRKDVR